MKETGFLFHKILNKWEQFYYITDVHSSTGRELIFLLLNPATDFWYIKATEEASKSFGVRTFPKCCFPTGTGFLSIKFGA